MTDDPTAAAPPEADAARYLLRPAAAVDLPGLERMAAESAIGITSLQPDREHLRTRLERSLHAFASADDASGEEGYLFVLEDQARGGALIGTCGIEASAGFHDRFYSYRNEFIVQVSPALGARNRVHTLHLCHDLTGVSLLTGFHIDPAYAGTLAPQLLSRGRLLFIAQHPDRFADRIASESPGLADDSGRCPFWDAVGRRFFGMDYPSAEAAAMGQGRSLIAELMPQSPLYVPLLPEEAQWALGQLHPVGELPFSILIDEGFDAETWLNIFDGGPTLEGRLPLLHSVARRQMLKLPAAAAAATWPAPQAGSQWRLVANTARQGFRATLLPAVASGAGLAGPALGRLADALHLRPGQPLAWVDGPAAPGLVAAPSAAGVVPP